MVSLATKNHAAIEMGSVMVELNSVIRDTRSSGSALRIEAASSLGTCMGWNQQVPRRIRDKRCH